MNLSSSQLVAIQNGEAVPIVSQGIPCVVLRQDVFDRVRKAIVGEQASGNDDEEIGLAWESGQSIGWDSAEMAEYDNYDEHRASQ
jgi:hypothetical protein